MRVSELVVAEGDTRAVPLLRWITGFCGGAAPAYQLFIAAHAAQQLSGAVPMERIDREGVNPNTGGEQTSFGSQLNDSDRGVGSRVKSVASSVKDKASGIPAMLADGLQAGAEALRQRRPSTETTAGSSVAVTSDPGIAAVTDTLASGMQSSAEWLRCRSRQAQGRGREAGEGSIPPGRCSSHSAPAI